MKKKLLIIISLIILSIILYGYFKSKNNKLITNVETYEVVKGDLNLSYEVQGSVKSNKNLLVYSKLSGKIKKVYFRQGDLVNKGDVLAEIDSSSLSSINTNIEKARINLKQRQQDYSNLLELNKLGGASNLELQRAKDNLDLAKLELENILNTSSDITNKIVSEVSGVITETNVDENLEIDRSKSLFEIVDVENLKVSAEIPNSKIRFVSIGNKVIITSDSLGDKEVIEKVDEISKISTTNSQFNDSVTPIKINLEKNTGLRPGDIVLVKIIFEELKNVLLIPYTYVDLDNNIAYVYVIDKDNIIRKKEVKLGKTDDLNYEVKSGLSVGDKILNNITKAYKDGDKLK